MVKRVREGTSEKKSDGEIRNNIPPIRHAAQAAKIPMLNL